MSDAVHIIINDTRARAILTGISKAGSDHEVREIMGRAATNSIQKHLRDMNDNAKRKHKFGPKSLNFYSRSADSTHYRHTPDGVQVAVTETGFALRYYGGTVRPNPPKKALAIPAKAEMYGYRPRERPEKMFVIWKPGKRAGVLATRAGSALRILYFLVSKATIRADKSLIEHDAIQQAVSKSLESYLKRIAARQGA